MLLNVLRCEKISNFRNFRLKMQLSQVDGNQLLFNLDAPATTQNVVVNARHPRPLIIEKFGLNASPHLSRVR